MAYLPNDGTLSNEVVEATKVIAASNFLPTRDASAAPQHIAAMLEKCARLRIGMSFSEVEGVVGSLHDRQPVAAIIKVLPAERPMALVVDNGICSFKFRKPAGGQFALVSWEPLPAPAANQSSQPAATSGRG